MLAIVMVGGGTSTQAGYSLAFECAAYSLCFTCVFIGIPLYWAVVRETGVAFISGTVSTFGILRSNFDNEQREKEALSGLGSGVGNEVRNRNGNEDGGRVEGDAVDENERDEKEIEMEIKVDAFERGGFEAAEKQDGMEDEGDASDERG